MICLHPNLIVDATDRPKTATERSANPLLSLDCHVQQESEKHAVIFCECPLWRNIQCADYAIVWGSSFRTTVILTPGACPGGSELHSVSWICLIRTIRCGVQICSNLRPLSKLSVLWSQMSDPSRTSAFRPSKTQGFWELVQAKVQKH